jgi:hypothetical protein
MAAPVGRYAGRDARSRVGREIHDGEAASRFERGEQAGVEVPRTYTHRSRKLIIHLGCMIIFSFGEWNTI